MRKSNMILFFLLLAIPVIWGCSKDRTTTDGDLDRDDRDQADDLDLSDESPTDGDADKPGEGDDDELSDNDADELSDGDVGETDEGDGDVNEDEAADRDDSDIEMTEGDGIDGSESDADTKDSDWLDIDRMENKEEEEALACNVYRGDHHTPGRQDPLKDCNFCHGSDLTGDIGRSCYSCHNANDHDVNRDGVMHSSNPCCQWCHGPNNTGGLGPACTKCHN